MIKTIEKYPLISLLVLVLLMLLPTLGEMRVTIMEARNFISAREMLSENNWILTTLNGEPRYEKPPLPTWITALFALVFGINNVYALRLPGVFMVWLTGVVVYKLSKQFGLAQRHAFINGIIAVSSFYVIAIIIEAPWDIYTHGFMMAAIYFLFKTYQKYSFQSLALAVLFMACSVMSKGPISLYALLLPFLLAYAVVFGIKNRWLLKTFGVLIPGIVLGSGWFVYVRFADPDAFLKIAGVETSNWSVYNVKPFYYYWSFFIQSGIWAVPAVIGMVYPYMKKRVKFPAHYKLTLLWTLFSVVLLSLIPEKKSRYLMPVLIPLAVTTGFYMHYMLEKFKSPTSRREIIPLYFHFGILGVAGILVPFILFFMRKDLAPGRQLLFWALAFGIAAAACCLFVLLTQKKMYRVFYLSVFIFVLVLNMLVSLYHRLPNQNARYKSISELRWQASKANIDIYVLDQISPEMLWNYGAILPVISKTDNGYVFPAARRFGVLATDSSLVNSNEFYEQFSIEKKGVYDINIEKLGRRKNRPRFISNYYIFTKKNTRQGGVGLLK